MAADALAPCINRSSATCQTGLCLPAERISSTSTVSVLRNDRICMMTSSNGNIFCVACPPFERGIHRSVVNSPHKGQWHGALMFSLICAWINSWVNNREAGDLSCHCTHYDITVMWKWVFMFPKVISARGLSHKQLKMNGYILSTEATDALVTIPNDD